MNADKTARERENKRRFRSRRKEYVAELEKTVRDLRNAGVQATKEMQLSARRVAQENARLRELLRNQGVGEDVVEAWVKEDQSLPEGVATRTPSDCHDDSTMVFAEAACSNTFSKIDAAKSSTSYLPSPASTNNENIQEVQAQPHEVHSIPEETCSSKAGKTCIKSITLHPASKPCKLMTHLASNPGADITQMDVSQDGTISHALETGCGANGSGGCKVRNEVLWKALDDIQRD